MNNKTHDLAKRLLEKDEGLQQYPYLLNGILHIGYGFNLDEVGIYPEEAEFILENRIRMAEKELLRNNLDYPMLSENRQAILLSLCYNMGISRLLSFRKFFEAISYKDWPRAAMELLDSKAAQQNPARMEKLAYCFEIDKL